MRKEFFQMVTKIDNENESNNFKFTDKDEQLESDLQSFGNKGIMQILDDVFAPEPEPNLKLLIA